MSAEEQTPVYLECRGCGHQWIAAWLPMPMGDFARRMRQSRRPRGCKGRKQIYLYQPGRAPTAPALPAPEPPATP